MDGIASLFEDVPGAGRARVLVAGDGREPLLFVHGWPASARVFWPLLTAPALRARFRMFAPDLFGFGRSTLRAPPLTFAHQVEAVLAVARRAGEPCVAVGTSYGARVLLEAVATAPALFSRAILLAPYLHRGLIGRSVEGRLLARFPRLLRALHRPPLSLVTGVWAALFSLAAAGASVVWARQTIPLIADVARMRGETVDLIDALPDGRPLLAELRVPVELWYGERDRLLDTRELAGLAPLRGLTVVRVGDGGHALHDSHAGELAAALLTGGDDDSVWRPVLRALIEAILAFDHPAFPAIGIDAVERRLLEYFPIAGDDGAPLRAGLIAFDQAFAAAADGTPFAAAPLAERRAALRQCARGAAPAQRRFYAGMKSMVLIAAYSLPELQHAVGHEGPA
ncbi:MAG TPA: alpha/beta fold hydrolase [Polyangia bacterium]|nr:alpha/beta fold hydrolase [Polyangia bacterium]